MRTASVAERISCIHSNYLCRLPQGVRREPRRPAHTRARWGRAGRPARQRRPLRRAIHSASTRSGMRSPTGRAMPGSSPTSRSITLALGPPVPRPRQVFALGLNYAMHAREAGLELPPMPLTFTKFPSCIAGPAANVRVATDRVDWEVELVVVIGRQAQRVDVDRRMGARGRRDGRPGHLGARRSDAWFAAAVQPRQVVSRIRPDGAVARHARRAARSPTTSRSAARSTASRCSATARRRCCSPCPRPCRGCRRSVRCCPGDLIFTGTPAGVGNRMDPPRYLRAGDELVSTVEGVGSITTRFR